MIDKKASHVGMVFSFVIFISFLLYLFSILSPLYVDRTEQLNFLNFLSENILDFIGVEIFKVILTSPEVGGNKFRIDSSSLGEGICFDDYFIVLKDSNERDVSFIRDSCDILFEGENGNIYSLYYSNFSFQEISPSSSISGGYRDVKINYFESNNYYLEYQFFNFSDFYFQDYNFLKKQLNINDLQDFGFSFQLENGSIISGGIAPLDIEVYSNEFEVLYYNEFLEQKRGILRVFIW